MAKILFLSKRAYSYSLATKLVEQGNEVDFYIQEGGYRKIGEGCSNPKTITYLPKPTSDYDLIIPDMVGMGRLGDRYRKAGKVVLGGGSFGDLVEGESSFSLKVAKMINLQVPDKEVKGISISIEGWFNGQEFLSPYLLLINYKRFMEGEKGLKTNCMGSVVIATDNNKIIERTLTPLQALLCKARYTGPFIVEVIVDQDLLWFRQFTCNLEYDSTQTLGEILKGGWFTFLNGLATHTLQRAPFLRDHYALGVRISMPPYPLMGSVELPLGVKVVNIPEQAKSHIWLSDVSFSTDGIPVMSGVEGVVGCITAWGETVKEAQRRVYRTIKNICIRPEIQYRLDIGSDVEERLKTLRGWGWV